MIEISSETPKIIENAQATVELISEDLKNQSLETLIDSLFHSMESSVALLETEEQSSEIFLSVCKSLTEIQNDFKGHLLTLKTLSVGFGIQGASIPGAEQRFKPFVLEMQDFISKIEKTFAQLQTHNQEGTQKAIDRSHAVTTTVARLQKLKEQSKAEIKEALN